MSEMFDAQRLRPIVDQINSVPPSWVPDDELSQLIVRQAARMCAGAGLSLDVANVERDKTIVAAMCAIYCCGLEAGKRYVEEAPGVGDASWMTS